MSRRAFASISTLSRDMIMAPKRVSGSPLRLNVRQAPSITPASVSASHDGTLFSGNVMPRVAAMAEIISFIVRTPSSRTK